MNSRQPEQGAVMLAVLAIAVVMSLLVGYASSTLNQRLELAQASLAKLKEIAVVEAKANELTYLIATQRVTVAGVSKGINASGLVREDDLWLKSTVGDEIRADGFLYKLADFEFSIQNEAGLIPINSSNQYWLRRWLSIHGYSPPNQNQLLAVLADYLDGDQVVRPRGRERLSSYPGNFLAQSCKELRRIEEWRGLIERHPDFLASCGLRRTPSLNLNSVPVVLAETLWPNHMSKIVSSRKGGKWVTRDSAAIELLPSLINVPEDMYTRFGGSTFIITISGKFSSIQRRVFRNIGPISAYASQEMH